MGSMRPSPPPARASVKPLADFLHKSPRRVKQGLAGGGGTARSAAAASPRHLATRVKGHPPLSASTSLIGNPASLAFVCRRCSRAISWGNPARRHLQTAYDAAATPTELPRGTRRVASLCPQGSRRNKPNWSRTGTGIMPPWKFLPSRRGPVLEQGVPFRWALLLPIRVVPSCCPRGAPGKPARAATRRGLVRRRGYGESGRPASRQRVRGAACREPSGSRVRRPGQCGGSIRGHA